MVPRPLGGMRGSGSAGALGSSGAFPWALPWALGLPLGPGLSPGPSPGPWWSLAEALGALPWALPWALGLPLGSPLGTGGALRTPWALRGPCGDRALLEPLQIHKNSCFQLLKTFTISNHIIFD